MVTVQVIYAYTFKISSFPIENKEFCFFTEFRMTKEGWLFGSRNRHITQNLSMEIVFFVELNDVCFVRELVTW